MFKKKVPLLVLISLSLLVLSPAASADGINFGEIGYRYHTTPGGTHVYWAFENLDATVDRMGLVNEGWTLINNGNWESNIRVVPESSSTYVSVEAVRPNAGGGVNAFKAEIDDSVEQEVTIIISGLSPSSEYNVYEDGNNIGSDVTADNGLFKFNISDVSSTYEIRKVEPEEVSPPSLGIGGGEEPLEVEIETGLYRDGVFNEISSFKIGEKVSLRVKTTKEGAPYDVDAVSVSVSLDDGVEKYLDVLSEGVYETEFLIPEEADIGAYVAEVRIRDGLDITEKTVSFDVVERRGIIYTLIENWKWVIAALLITISYLALWLYED